jgi:hypothetical protein
MENSFADKQEHSTIRCPPALGLLHAWPWLWPAAICPVNARWYLNTDFRVICFSGGSFSTSTSEVLQYRYMYCSVQRLPKWPRDPHALRGSPSALGIGRAFCAPRGRLWDRLYSSIVEIPYVPQSRHRVYLKKFCRKLTFCWWLWQLMPTQGHFCSFKHRAHVEPCEILISLAASSTSEI